MLVKKDEFFTQLQRLCDANFLSLDTETTGLKAYHDDELFCVVASTGRDLFYFNFHPEHPECLPKEYVRHFTRVSRNVCKTVFMANAKFDMAMLFRDGVDGWRCKLHDVLSVQRLIQSDALKNNLDAVAKFFGLEKSDAVETYIKDNHLWEWVQIPGKRTREKSKHFYKVPFEIIYDYALKDAEITYQIGMRQLEKWGEIKAQWGHSMRTMRDPLQIEYGTTVACFELEKRGVLVDVEFCKQKAEQHETLYRCAQREFFDLTGTRLIDSSKTLAPIFKATGATLPKTEKGQDSITDAWLEKNPSPIAKGVRTFRENQKLANTYFKAFLWHRDRNDFIHADIRQGGTRTGRFSYGVPNLQNVPKDGAARKAFIPRKDFALVSIDYDQQEYRMMLDYAGEKSVIDAVLSGLDVHEATAQMMGKTRQEAKTLNFLLLYGGGVVKLAQSLFKQLADFDEQTLWGAFWKWKDRPEKAKVDVPKETVEQIVPFLEQAELLRNLYFDKLPQVQRFISNVKLAAEKNKKIHTWTARPIHFPNRAFSYKAPNALIQGGCSDVAKIALIELDEFLRDKLSKTIVLVHDEFLFEIHKSEFSIVPEIKRIMESVYPKRFIPLTCSVAYSFKSWGDLEDGEPCEETGNEVQGKDHSGFETTPERVVHQDARSIEAGHA